MSLCDVIFYAIMLRQGAKGIIYICIQSNARERKIARVQKRPWP